MKFKLSVFILLLSLKGLAQTTVIDVNKINTGGTVSSNLIYAVGGVPMNNAKYVAIVEGTPFFSEAYFTGKIILSGGKVYDKIKLRLDLMDNSVHYMSTEGEELVATTPIKTVFLYDAASQKEIRFDNSEILMTHSTIEKPGWYELLDTGTVRLYKRHNKSIRENKPYGSATTEQYITTSYSYYIFTNTVFTPVKKFKALPDMLQDKKTELQEYINLNSLTGKSDKDYLVLVAYYNSLVKK